MRQPRTKTNPMNLTTLTQNKLLMYLGIGGTASAIDVGLFLLFYELFDFSAISSHTVSIGTSALFSFSMNAVFNFKKTDKLLFRALSFAIVVFLGYLLGAFVIYITEQYTPFGASVGKLASLPLVFIFQYFLNSRVSFS